MQPAHGVYAILEISIVGRSEEELTDAGGSIRSRLAVYNEISRSQILGDSESILKLIFTTQPASCLTAQSLARAPRS